MTYGSTLEQSRGQGVDSGRGGLANNGQKQFLKLNLTKLENHFKDQMFKHTKAYKHTNSRSGSEIIINIIPNHLKVSGEN